MALIFGASVWTGFQAAASVRKAFRQLAQLRVALELMRCEISCRLTPARKLMRIVADSIRGELAGYFSRTEAALARGDSVEKAAQEAAAHTDLRLPAEVCQSLDELFGSFGGYDAAGQLRMIELTQTRVADALQHLADEKPKRCRCYEILGLCTGLALVILVA